MSKFLVKRAAPGATLLCFVSMMLGGCETPPYADSLPEAQIPEYNYIIGPGDSLNIFVWRNPELTQSVTVRPDGKVSAPLVEDLVATGKTATQLSREIEEILSTYVRDPLVTVIIGGFGGIFDTQIRVLGEATNPTSLPYRADLTLLDLMIQVGGVTEFAAGNKARLVRSVNGEQQQMLVRLEDLIEGDISANVKMAPGDILIIPEAWF